jgi:hypothetical protein
MYVCMHSCVILYTSMYVRIYIYIYIYVCVCVCVYLSERVCESLRMRKQGWIDGCVWGEDKNYIRYD